MSLSTPTSDLSCSPPPLFSERTNPLFRRIALVGLTLLTLLIHGYHPFAEDGGLYVAGVQSILDPSLFPHDLAFVSTTSHYSLFAPLVAQIVRTTHLPLPWLLLLANLAGTWLMLYAAWRISAQFLNSEIAQFFSVALLAAWFTLPIAGTSLLLMDPYVTARTLSTPLSLLAIAFALNSSWSPAQRGNLLRTLLCLAAAAALHPLMATYAAAFVLAIFIARLGTSRARIAGWVTLAASALLIASLLQLNAPAESAPTVAAAFSRYYWFLSEWQWFELLGLAGPLLVLTALLRFARRTLGPSGVALCRAGIVIGLIATLISSLFAHEHYATHLVARFQPLRAFLLLYAVMIVLLGGTLANACLTLTAIYRITRVLPPLFVTAMAFTMLFVQRQTFPESQHLELPGRTPTNPWSQAFVWAREHTPPDALFALDADYITTHGEDGQTFRATAQRSVLPDFSKDGGQAAIHPSLSATWFEGLSAQQNLSGLNDEQRSNRLQSSGLTWVVLHAAATTAADCPYKNAVVKVCSLTTAFLAKHSAPASSPPAQELQPEDLTSAQCFPGPSPATASRNCVAPDTASAAQ